MGKLQKSGEVEFSRARTISRARTARVVALILCLTMVLWLGLQWLGGHFGWAARWVFLFDLAALAAFLWAMIVTVGLWRARKDG